MQTEFYEKRRLPAPQREIRPRSPQQLADEISSLAAGDNPWRLVGDGQHIRDFPADDTVAVHTGELDDILELDRESGTVRVQAGISWNELDAAVVEEGFSLQRYGLHPSTATVGGLLARHRVSPPLLRGGDLLDGCIAVGAFHPCSGDYRYLAAPRKATGPDLRHLFVGAGHSGGAIVDATLVVWKSEAARLVVYDDCTPKDAARIVNALFEASITPAWMHYGFDSGRLQFALVAPGQLLRSRVGWLTDRVGEPDTVGDGEDAGTRKRWLQSRHPHRRSHPDAEVTRLFWITPSALGDDPEELFGGGVADVEIPEWTPRRAAAFVRYESPQMADAGADAPPEGTCWATRTLI